MTPKKRKPKLSERITSVDIPPESPPHPWAGPSPEAKAAAEPAKTAVESALREIKSPAQADQVAAEVIAAAGGTTNSAVTRIIPSNRMLIATVTVKPSINR